MKILPGIQKSPEMFNLMMRMLLKYKIKTISVLVAIIVSE